jgi:hypothetical protein
VKSSVALSWLLNATLPWHASDKGDIAHYVLSFLSQAYRVVGYNHISALEVCNLGSGRSVPDLVLPHIRDDKALPVAC